MRDDSKHPYPDRVSDDSALLVRLAADVSHWWGHRIGLLTQTFTVISVIVTVVGIVGGALIGFGTLKANFADVPERLEGLETSYEEHLHTMAVPMVAATNENSARIDSLRRELSAVRRALGELRNLSEANNCWIRVAAGEESRFNCTPGSD